MRGEGRGEEGRGGGGRETEWSGSRRRPSRAQPRPVCNLPNDLSPGLIITVVPSPTKQSGGILFKNNCVPSCDGFLCLITANCSEFTSIMARLTRRLCNTGECGREKKKKQRERDVVPQATAIPVRARRAKNPRLVTRIDLLPCFHDQLWEDLFLSYSRPLLKEVNFVNIACFIRSVKSCNNNNISVK